MPKDAKTKFAVLVRIDSTNTWFRGPQRFATREDAEEAAWNAYQLHPSFKECVVVEMPEEGDADGTE